MFELYYKFSNLICEITYSIPFCFAKYYLSDGERKTIVPELKSEVSEEAERRREASDHERSRNWRSESQSSGKY